MLNYVFSEPASVLSGHYLTCKLCALGGINMWMWQKVAFLLRGGQAPKLADARAYDFSSVWYDIFYIMYPLHAYTNLL